MRGRVQVARLGQRGTNGENLRGNADKVTPLLKGNLFLVFLIQSTQ